MIFKWYLAHSKYNWNLHYAGHDIMGEKFEISLAVFMPNITPNQPITDENKSQGDVQAILWVIEDPLKVISVIQALQYLRLLF